MSEKKKSKSKTSPKKTRALTGQRDFDLAIPSYQGVHDGSSWSEKGDKSAVPPLDGNGWRANGASSIYYETYLDLSALELDDLTLMPISIGLQDPGFYTQTTATKEMIVMDIMSQQRLSPDLLTQFMNPTSNEFNNAPAMGGSPIDFHMITMGNMRIMYPSTQVTFSGTIFKPFITQFSAPFGSGAPVVTQKLWVYRFVFYVGANTEALQVPASRFILRGELSKEKKYVYIQRLKQSYELQQS